MKEAKQIVLKGTEENPVTVLHVFDNGEATLSQVQFKETVHISLDKEETALLVNSLKWEGL